jgi:hypothetical protein
MHAQQRKIAKARLASSKQRAWKPCTLLKPLEYIDRRKTWSSYGFDATWTKGSETWVLLKKYTVYAASALSIDSNDAVRCGADSIAAAANNHRDGDGNDGEHDLDAHIGGECTISEGYVCDDNIRDDYCGNEDVDTNN